MRRRASSIGRRSSISATATCGRTSRSTPGCLPCCSTSWLCAGGRASACSAQPAASPHLWPASRPERRQSDEATGSRRHPPWRSQAVQPAQAHTALVLHTARGRCGRGWKVVGLGRRPQRRRGFLSVCCKATPCRTSNRIRLGRRRSQTPRRTRWR